MHTLDTDNTQTRFLKPQQWRTECAQDIFETYGSLQWFFRMHRDELLESGELLIRGGAGGTLCGPGLRATVIAIMKRESRERLSRKSTRDS